MRVQAGRVAGEALLEPLRSDSPSLDFHGTEEQYPTLARILAAGGHSATTSIAVLACAC
jgi:hypothetical protein